MTKPIHVANAFLYALNGLMWAFYAHAMPMAIMCFGVAIASAFYADKMETWRW